MTRTTGSARLARRSAALVVPQKFSGVLDEWRAQRLRRSQILTAPYGRAPQDRPGGATDAGMKETMVL